MKFSLAEPTENVDFQTENPSWVLSKQISINRLLFFGIILGIISAECFALIIKNITLCNNFDFHIYKKLYLIIFIIPVHELFHLLFFPNPNKSTIGFSRKGVIFYVTTSEIFTKSRFIIVLLMPILLLSLIPFILLFTINNEILAYLAMFNLIGSGADIVSLFMILKYPRNSLFRYNGMKLYIK